MQNLRGSLEIDIYFQQALSTSLNLHNLLYVTPDINTRRYAYATTIGHYSLPTDSLYRLSHRIMAGCTGRENKEV